jgi:hypothetical protein
MLGRALRIALVALALALAGPAGAVEERRVALVIGNGAYAALGPLRNPVNDAADVAAALESLGFEVRLGLDVGRDEMLALIDAHAEASEAADASLFYYAGHGFQVAARNYLVPVDAALRGAADVPAQTVRLDDVLEPLAASDATKLVFLDACRDNPLQGTGSPAEEVVESGLARVGDAAGFLIAFSTQPDNVAEDGAGRNSPFTKALLSHMTAPGRDIASTMISVRKDVLAATGGLQIPWENSSLTEEFQFAPGDETASPETLLWQVAASGQDPALLRIYLERYPEGAHVADVRALLDKVQIAALPDAGDTVTRALPGTGAVAEETMWDLARRMRLRPLVEIYLHQHPQGRFADEARRLLAALPNVEEEAASPELLCERLATHPRDATANTAGVPLSQLATNAELAIDACTRAAAARPQSPHFTALLARAFAAAGRLDEAVEHYRDAAARGDLRAAVSLGLMTETGDGVPRDLAAAAALYERAAERGFPDGAINLAVMLINGEGVARDVDRAKALLSEAADAGSPIATFNLGVLALERLPDDADAALAYFQSAAALGEPRGYVAAARLLDKGVGVARDPASAADMLLRGAASDAGQAVEQLTTQAENWSPDTIRAAQTRLADAGFYDGAADGVSGPRFAAALGRWRGGGLLGPASGG